MKKTMRPMDDDDDFGSPITVMGQLRSISILMSQCISALREHFASRAEILALRMTNRYLRLRLRVALLMYEQDD